MDHDVEALRAEVAELRAQLAELRATSRATDDARVTRRRLLTGLAGVGAAGVAGVAMASPAAAADGDALRLGEDNLATSRTLLSNAPTPGEGLPDFPEDTSGALLRLEDVGDGNGLVALSTGTAITAQGFEGMRVWGEAQGLVVGSDGIVALGANGYGDGAAVAALSENGPAIWARSEGGIQLVLNPRTIDGPGSNSSVDTGSISVDHAVDVWLCTQGGATPTWTRLLREDTASGRTVPIAPMRAIDTRAPGGRPAGSPAVPGQKTGPLKGGTSVTLDLAGIGAIPATATGVIGNLAVVTPSFSGYLAARPSGTPAITTTLNFPTGVAALANAFTSQLGPAGLTITGSGTSTNTYHLVVDITAYIT
jgi:hypothetical protein